MENRRGKERHHLVHFLRIFDRDTGEEIGNMVNITLEGLRLVGQAPIDKGASHRLRMDFPQEFIGKEYADRLEIFMGRGHVEFDGTCKWCDVDINPELYAIGFQLQNISKDDKRVLEELIEFYRD